MSEDINVGAISEALNNKADRDLNNTNPLARVVVEVSDKSLMPSWYRVYSDGWCEQGGRTTTNFVAPAAITFLKTFKDINYNSFAGIGGVGSVTNNNYPIMTLGKKVSGMNIENYSSSTGANNYYEWQASGYIN